VVDNRFSGYAGTLARIQEKAAGKSIISMEDRKLYKIKNQASDLTSVIHGATAEVSLVFPPLVDTNFGSYFPSTAVLAAFLSTNGITSAQRDLNEEFALHLLRPESLKRMANGHFCDGQTFAADSMPVVAARVLSRVHDRLFDQDGRHRFRDQPGTPAYLLRTIARPYRFEVLPSELANIDFYTKPVVSFYEAFFDESGYVQNLEATIHTVGISVAMGPQLAPALILARWLKNRRPDLIVILGGPVLSLMKLADLDALLLGNTAIDAVVRFDGEKPLLELVRQQQTGDWSPQEVAGVSSRVAGRVTHAPPTAGPRLDQLPYALYDSTIMSQLADPVLGVIQARGCYWGKCAYCDYVELYDGSPAYRTRTPESFIDEMRFQQQKYDVRRFLIITESIPPAFARKISELILSAGLDVEWTSFAMVDRRFDKGLLSLMARAGCDYLVIGLETMTDRVLKLVHKSATREENIRFLRDAKAAGLRLRINLIPDLPSTTYEEAIDSLKVLQGLRDCLWSISVFPFEATSSSAVGRSLGEYGLRVIQDETGGQAQFALNHMNVEDPAMTDHERQAVLSAYRTFANEINSQGDQEIERLNIDEHTYLRIADERLDVIEKDASLYCYDWVARQPLSLHKGWKRILETARSMSPFRKTDFLSQFPSPEIGELFFTELQKHRLLEKEWQTPELVALDSSVTRNSQAVYFDLR